jgi:hypothetical protein
LSRLHLHRSAHLRHLLCLHSLAALLPSLLTLPQSLGQRGVRIAAETHAHFEILANWSIVGHACGMRHIAIIACLALAGCSEKEVARWWAGEYDGAAAIMAIGIMNAGAAYQAVPQPVYRAPVQCFSSANLRQTSCW